MKHKLQTDVPVASVLYEPARHAVHAADVLAVAKLPNDPTVQAVHAVEVEAAAILP